MIPADLSFHDATIAAIRREGSGYVLDVEDVAVDHGDDVINGTLTFEDVRRVLIDGKEATELTMAGDDGEILELEELPGPSGRQPSAHRALPSGLATADHG